MPQLKFKWADYFYALGLTIKYYRLLRGWIQDELAERTGTHKSQICAIEKGKEPNYRTIITMCFAMGIEPFRMVYVRKDWKAMKKLTQQMEDDLRKKRKIKYGKKKKNCKTKRLAKPLHKR